MTLKSRYLLNMLGVSILHFFAFISFMLITGKMDRILVAIPINLILLVGVNLVGAWIFFMPIQKYLNGELELSRVVKRIHQLPWMSSAWACVLVSAETKNLAESKLMAGVEFIAKGELPIRGKTEAVKVYEVLPKR